MRTNTELEVEQYVAHQLSNRLGASFDVLTEYLDKGGQRQDIAVLFNRTVVAFIECKRKADVFVNGSLSKEWLNYLYKNEDPCFFFVADKTGCFFFLKEDNSFKRVSFDEVASIIKDAFAVEGRLLPLEEVLSIINEIAKKYRIWKRLHYWINSIKENDIIFHRDSSECFFSNDMEDNLFLQLLGSLDSRKLCRYTTLNSLFELLDKQKQNMCNIVCMNDRGEYRYADEYVYDRYPQLGSKDFDELDSCFILSLLDKKMEDDLTMWRLYGDNANGSCLSYEAKSIIRQGKYKQFFLAKVSYGASNGTHRELDFVKAMMAAFKKLGWNLVLSRWNIWKHFFKSYHFAIEKEVRLMYYDAPATRKGADEYKWIKNSNSQIVTKMQLFDFASFPLKIESACIGPKCQEVDLLARQFMAMGSGIMPLGFSVKCSAIKDYR